MEEAYEKIRKDILNLGITVKTNFTVTLREPDKKQGDSWNDTELEKAIKELKYVRSDAKNISTGHFSSASAYAEKSECGLRVPSHYVNKWVKGIFGSGKYKNVRMYEYDAEMAIFYIASRAEEIEDDFRERTYDALGSAFSVIKEDIINQFSKITGSITAELETEKNKMKQRQQIVQKEKSNIQKKINQLNEYLDEIRSM